MRENFPAAALAIEVFRVALLLAFRFVSQLPLCRSTERRCILNHSVFEDGYD